MVGNWIQSLILPAGSNSLLIETNQDGWAKCFLIGNERIYLGADDFTIIFSRLRDTLTSIRACEGLPAGKIEGLPVAWSLSLAEAHHALYVADDDSDRVLFWQNAHQSPVSIIGVMRLSLSQRQSWVATLSRALDEANKPSLIAA